MLENVDVFATYDEGYACGILYPDSGYKNLYLIDSSNNGSTHTRILPDDNISVLCRFVGVSSDGRPNFSVDYIIEIENK